MPVSILLQLHALIAILSSAGDVARAEVQIHVLPIVTGLGTVQKHHVLVLVGIQIDLILPEQSACIEVDIGVVGVLRHLQAENVAQQGILDTLGHGAVATAEVLRDKILRQVDLGGHPIRAVPVVGELNIRHRHAASQISRQPQLAAVGHIAQIHLQHAPLSLSRKGGVQHVVGQIIRISRRTVAMVSRGLQAQNGSASLLHAAIFLGDGIRDPQLFKCR